jgi:hypothetical protein
VQLAGICIVTDLPVPSQLLPMAELEAIELHESWSVMGFDDPDQAALCWQHFL